MVKLATRDRVLLEAPFYVEQSLVTVSPKRVKVGEPFTDANQRQSAGPSSITRSAVTYDNAAMGYACGFNSNGDITINLIASGEPGTHLIDLYPAIYKGKDRVPWNYQTPFLISAEDFPALSVGYRLPAYRLELLLSIMRSVVRHVGVLLVSVAILYGLTKTTMSLSQVISPTAGQAGEDPYLWLEDVGGERALTWVRAHNAASTGELEGAADFAEPAQAFIGDIRIQRAHCQRHQAWRIFLQLLAG